WLLNCVRARQQRLDARLDFLLLTSIWCFVFYSLSGSKRPGYILPAMPPLALALGGYLNILLESYPHWRPRAAWNFCVATAFAALFICVQFGLPAYARRYSMRGQIRPFVTIGDLASTPVICYPRG